MTGRQPIDVPAETISKIRALFLAGKSRRDIAREVGLGKEVVCRRLAPFIAEMKARGETLPSAKFGMRSKVTPEIRARMVAMLDAGANLSQIARNVGIGETAVSNHLAPELAARRAKGKDWWRSSKALEKRAAIVAVIMEGVPYEEIARRFKMTVNNAYRYRLHLSPEQLRTRKLREREWRQGQGGRTRPSGDTVYAKIAAVIPRWLSDASRDDAISDLYLAVLQGQVALADVPTVAARYASRVANVYENRFGPRSLDERLFDDSDATLGEMIVDPTALSAFDYIFEEAL